MLIRKNKSHKERYVALSDDVRRMCEDYRSATAGVYPRSAYYFFPSPSGTPYDHHWLKKQFQMILEKANLKAGGSKAVVYSLRHRYATTMLMRWLDEGADIAAKLPYLSSCMGHTNFSDTAYYIHLLPENLIRSAAIDWGHFLDLIPEVAEDE
jgi:integrase